MNPLRYKYTNCQFDGEHDVYIFSKYLTTKYLLIAKSKIATLKWRKLASTILVKKLKWTSSLQDKLIACNKNTI